MADDMCAKCGIAKATITITLPRENYLKRRVCEECQSEKNKNSFYDWLREQLEIEADA